MDIQKMVDARINRLQNQALMEERRSRTFSGDRAGGNGPGPSGFPERLRDPGAGRQRYGLIQDDIDADHGLAQTLSEFDRSLERVAQKVLDVTESLAGDYARFENEILRSRLSVLQSAESVLDAAIMLRDCARRMSGTAHPERNLQDAERWQDESTQFEMGDLQYDGGRASMHRHGVAALFRKTQQ